MLHPLIVQVLEEEKEETIEFIATPLRYSSSHMAEMTHAQLLSDVAILCECFWCMVQGTAQDNVTCHQTFLQYFCNRRKIGMNERELHMILTVYYKSLSDFVLSIGTKSESQEALSCLESVFKHLDELITESAIKA